MLVTNWSGTCYIFPLLGAFIADSYLGRYRTIIIFSIIYIIVGPLKQPYHSKITVLEICAELLRNYFDQLDKLQTRICQNVTAVTA